MKNQPTLKILLQNTILEKIGKHRSLLVAYSGGVDSSVLLHALVILKQQLLPDLKLTAIHIHHGISKNADVWVDHCREQCQIWNIPFIVEEVQLALDKGDIERQARDLRYQAISKYLQPETVLCIAQHLDDQSETFFLALKRGSGPMGLSAMPQACMIDENHLLRPLLTISRKQIEQYASDCQLTWIEDESNQDDHYDRNFLRLKVLPILNQRWPHFNQMVTRSAELCQEQQQLLDELLSHLFNSQLDEQKNLLLDPILHESSPKRNALLRMWLKLHQISMPSRKQLEMLWQTVALAKKDSNPQFLLDDKQIRRYQQRLYLLPKYQDLQSVQLDWNLKESLILPDELGILSVVDSDKNCRLPKVDEVVTVRFYTGGQFQIIGRNGSRQIKKLWQELGVPPWMRTRIPLIFYNETLISAVNVFVTKQGAGDEIKFTVKA